MTFLKSFTKVALITTTALTVSFSAKATDSFNPEFIAQAQNLSGSNPVLFQGFQGTDFESLRAFLRPLTGNLEERVVPKALVKKLYDRVVSFADSDPRQNALAVEVHAALTNQCLDIFSYTAMIMRHQVFLRLKSGQACDFEKISMEVPGALGYDLFEKVQNPKFWNSTHLVASFIESVAESFDDYNPTINRVAAELGKKDGSVPYIFYPAFNQHELGIVYLAYMFLNEAFPVSCPASVGPNQLHGMTMSQAGEIFHDFLHAVQFGSLTDHYVYATRLMNNYRDFLTGHVNQRRLETQSEDPTGAYVRPAFGIPAPQKIALPLLNLMREKEDLMRLAMNKIFYQATKSFVDKTLSENEYTTLMVGIFNRAHEDYFDGASLFASRNVAEMLEAFFMTSHYDESAVPHDKSSVDLNNPFVTNVLDGSSPLSDKQILDRATKLPLKKFEGHYLSDMLAGHAYDIIGGEVRRTPYHIGVTLQTQTGETLVLAQSSANYKWRLSAAHDTYLANLGSKGLGLPNIEVPDLKLFGQNHGLAHDSMDRHISAVEERFSKIHQKAKDISMSIVSGLPGDIPRQSLQDQINTKFAELTTAVVNLFPESARAKVFGDIAAPALNNDDDGVNPRGSSLASLRVERGNP